MGRCSDYVLQDVLNSLTKPRWAMGMLGTRHQGFDSRGDAGDFAAGKLSNRALLSKKIVKK